jgi:hypothetical protein
MVGPLRPKKPQVREHSRSIGKALGNRANCLSLTEPSAPYRGEWGEFPGTPELPHLS